MVSNKAMNLEKLETNDSENIVFIGGVLIERAHYYTKLAERGRTIRKAVPIEDGALTEGVRYTKYCTPSVSTPAYYKGNEFLRGRTNREGVVTKRAH